MQPETVEPTLPPGFALNRDQQISQWVFEAEANSEYANPEWAASQVIGEPDTSLCGDYHTAWASAGSDSIAWLDVKFPIAVYVTGVNIHQSFNPNQVVKVELLGSFDGSTEIYSGDPVQEDQECPFTFMIETDKTVDRFDSVRITVDQSVLGLGWNQIDAVELVGETE